MGEGEEVRPGTVVSDLTLMQPDGTPVGLSSLYDQKFLLLVFLRHLV